MIPILKYVRGETANSGAFNKLQAKVKKKFKDRQADPHDNVAMFYKDGSIVDQLKVLSKFKKCSVGVIESNMVYSMPAISVRPNTAATQDIQYLVNEQQSVGRSGSECKRTLFVTELIGKKYLVIFIERTSNNGKVRTPVHINEIITLDNYKKPNAFKLKSAIIHCGTKMNKGHYVAFVVNSLNGKWYLYDDDKKPMWTPFLNFTDFNKTKYGQCGTLQNDSTTLLYEVVQ